MSLILANKANSVLMGTTKMLPIWGGGGVGKRWVFHISCLILAPEPLKKRNFPERPISAKANNTIANENIK